MSKSDQPSESDAQQILNATKQFQANIQRQRVHRPQMPQRPIQNIFDSTFPRNMMLGY